MNNLCQTPQTTTGFVISHPSKTKPIEYEICGQPGYESSPQTKGLDEETANPHQALKCAHSSKQRLKRKGQYWIVSLQNLGAADTAEEFSCTGQKQ